MLALKESLGFFPTESVKEFLIGFLSFETKLIVFEGIVSSILFSFLV